MQIQNVWCIRKPWCIQKTVTSVFQIPYTLSNGRNLCHGTIYLSYFLSILKSKICITRISVLDSVNKYTNKKYLF